MKNLVYLLFLFLFIGSSFTYKNSTVKPKPSVDALVIAVEVKQPETTTSNDGSLQVIVSGGTAPYTIQVVSTFSPSQVYKKATIELKKLGVGNYTIMVQDAEKHVLQKNIELTSRQ